MAVFDILLSIILFFILLLQHSGTLVPSWHEFKSFVTVEINELLFSFMIGVELAIT